MNYFPKIKTGIPYVPLFINGWDNEWEGLSRYESWNDTYEIYDGTSWITAIKDTNSSDYDHYVLKYKNNGNIDYTIIEYNNYDALLTGVRSLTSATDMVILYGSLTAPANKARLIPGTIEHPPYLAYNRYRDGVYQWDIVGQIAPKIICKNFLVPESGDSTPFDNLYVNELYMNENHLTTAVFNNQKVHTELKPQVTVDIIEKSSPVDPSIGYQDGETILFEIRISNTSPNYWTSQDSQFGIEYTGDKWSLPDFGTGACRNNFQVSWIVTSSEIAATDYIDFAENSFYFEGTFEYMGVEPFSVSEEDVDYIINSPKIKIGEAK